MKRLSTAVLLAVMLAVTPRASFATSIVVPSANAATEGNTGTFIPTSDSQWAFQWIFGASQFSSIASGDLLTSIGFRLDGGQATTPAVPIVYSAWNLQLSTSNNAVGSLSNSYAGNMGSDATTVRSGSLTIPVNAFAGGPGPNPFFFIAFTTPYTYTGGDLLITLRHSAQTSGLTPDLDAVALPLAGITDSIGTSGDMNATTSTQVHFFNVPVTAFEVTSSQAAPVPEPISLLLLGTGVVAGGVRRYRARGNR